MFSANATTSILAAAFSWYDEGCAVSNKYLTICQTTPIDTTTTTTSTTTTTTTTTTVGPIEGRVCVAFPPSLFVEPTSNEQGELAPNYQQTNWLREIYWPC